MTDRELMQQALKALDYMTKGTIHGGNDLTKAAIAALRERLAQPVQEPVRREQRMYMDEQEFYTAPPKRKPLTDDEIANAANLVRWSQQYHVDFARAIEAAHGIKE